MTEDFGQNIGLPDLSDVTPVAQSRQFPVTQTGHLVVIIGGAELISRRQTKYIGFKLCIINGEHAGCHHTWRIFPYAQNPTAAAQGLGTLKLLAQLTGTEGKRLGDFMYKPFMVTVVEAPDDRYTEIDRVFAAAKGSVGLTQRQLMDKFPPSAPKAYSPNVSGDENVNQVTAQVDHGKDDADTSDVPF